VIWSRTGEEGLPPFIIHAQSSWLPKFDGESGGGGLGGIQSTDRFISFLSLLYRLRKGAVGGKRTFPWDTVGFYAQNNGLSPWDRPTSQLAYG
jgi:hypothetical protein